MTAPSAAHLPPSARRPAAAPRRPRPRRTALGLAAAALLTATASGCVTVHGSTALVPSARKADAQRALDHFVTVSNAANSRLDPSPVAAVETGALGAIDGSGIKIRHVNHPAGNPGYQPLVLSDTRFLIPRQRGWPKWFVADTADNRDKGRWLLTFVRDRAGQPWKASYLLVVGNSRLPDVAVDADGYAEPVPLAGTGLLVQPGELARRYTDYLQHGDKVPAVFAAGRYTSLVRQDRRTRYAPNPQYVTAFADQAADPAQYAPVALRLRNGGAMVFFTTDHQMKQTVAKGPVNVRDAGVRAILTGTPNTSVTLFRIAEQVVTVPAAGSAGTVVFLDHIDQLVAAHGG